MFGGNFGPNVVKLYTAANEVHNSAAPIKFIIIKTNVDAKNARALLAMELIFMFKLGCDCELEWNFDDV